MRQLPPIAIILSYFRIARQSKAQARRLTIRVQEKGSSILTLISPHSTPFHRLLCRPALPTEFHLFLMNRPGPHKSSHHQCSFIHLFNQTPFASPCLALPSLASHPHPSKSRSSSLLFPHLIMIILRSISHSPLDVLHTCHDNQKY